MSNHSIPGKDLREMVTGFRKIIPRHGDDLRRVRIDLKRGTITATDGSSYLSYQLGKPVPKGVCYTMSFDGILHFSKGLPPKEQVNLEETSGEQVRFRAPERQCFGEAARDDSFADPPRIVGSAQLLHPEEREAILRTLTCASTDDNRYVLRGVYFDNEEGTTKVVATDGRCLYHEPLRKLEIPRPFILPASPLLTWRGFRHDWQLKLGRNKRAPTMIQLTAGQWTFTTPAIDGNYPNWRQVLPDLRSRPTRLTLGEHDVAALESTKAGTIGLEVAAVEPRFLLCDKDTQKWASLVAKDSESKGPPTTVHLDSKFFKRALDAGAKEICNRSSAGKRELADQRQSL
jgi:hypothetical protein